MSNEKKKINVGIFGGAFDPIHTGHIAVAERVRSEFDWLDEIWIMPCNKSISGKKMTPGFHRLSMCMLSVSRRKRLIVSPYEIYNDLNGITYDIMTDIVNGEKYKNTHDFWFIIGEDNAVSFDKWRHFNELRDKFKFIVVGRYGYKDTSNWFSNKPHLYICGDLGKDISSTKVRSIIRDQNFDKTYVDRGVYDYAIKNNLYG